MNWRAASLAALLNLTAGASAGAQTPPASAKPPATQPAKKVPAAHVPVVKQRSTPAKQPVAAASVKPATAPPPPAAAAPVIPNSARGSVTGRNLPRWASFRFEEVNLRAGPGMQYPIDWVYHRRDLPVQIQREYEIWRLIQDQDGTKGWVNQATLTGRRGFVVQAAEQVLRAGAADTADPVARLKPGVVGHVRACAAGAAWCEVQAGEYRGWLKREQMYGVSADEAIE